MKRKYIKRQISSNRICAKNRIFLNKVNPAWTSWVAKEKYCPRMKLNMHSGASYVIARRGMNLKDKIK